jgi:acyl-CoA synthetase (NDP forming)
MSGAPVVAMLEARSVAVVGASATPGSFGEQMMIQLVTSGGFDGATYPVNPKYDELFGLPCAPSITDVPGPVDLAIIGVANALLEEQLLACARAGARSAVIFASAFEPPSDGPPLIERLREIAVGSGMALCGPNGMGFLNVERRLRVCGFHEPADLEPGGIAFISHSGSAFSAMLHNRRGLRFNLVVSSGLELVTTMDEYLTYALDLDSTRAVALFMETVRHPEGFRSSLARAAERDVPVVAMKVGHAQAAKELVAAHSGALAGDDGAYEALFDAFGVLRVRTMDEMADTLELLSAGRRARPGGLAAIHDSGGERAHLIDAAEEAGVPFAEIGPETVARLQAALDPGLPAVNPLDAWGTGRDAEAQFVECMQALLDDPDTAALAFCVDLTTEVVPGAGYARGAEDIVGRTDKPVAVLSNLRSAIDPLQSILIRAAGMPVLEGTATGLAAFRHLFDHRDWRGRPSPVPATPVADAVRTRWLDRLATGEVFDEREALALLTDYGVPVVPVRAADSLDEAMEAASALGWPIALKAAAAGLLHKSDADGVRLNLKGPDQLRAEYTDLASRLGPRVVVAKMAPPGVELALGIVRDHQFGPLVMVAAGGLLVEVLRDRTFALPPVDPNHAGRMLDRLAVRALLDGVRGRHPANLNAVTQAIARLSLIAEDLGRHLEAVDVNPLIAGPDGCVAVDALVIPRAT